MRFKLGKKRVDVLPVYVVDLEFNNINKPVIYTVKTKTGNDYLLEVFWFIAFYRNRYSELAQLNHLYAQFRLFNCYYLLICRFTWSK